MTQILELKKRITELERQSRLGGLGPALEARIREAQKLESFTEVAIGVVHDFNNLLVALRGNVDLALAKLPASCEARVFVERIEKASLRAADLADHMLAYGRRHPRRTEPVDLGRLVEEMADLLRSSVSKQARLELRLAGDLPAVEGDATQIRQVVMNLIKNGAEALGGEGTVTVSTAALELRGDARREYRPAVFEPRGRYVLLEVADTGRGMDRETQAKIFDPFFTTKAEGHGLGLAAVLCVVRTHGGGIAVDSEPGKGTRFQVLLPARRR
ncbi:MAG TPA: ATP-binding protein [Thermoanaerobaculia bacterium]